jgi:hypothetical protein
MREEGKQVDRFWVHRFVERNKDMLAVYEAVLREKERGGVPAEDLERYRATNMLCDRARDGQSETEIDCTAFNYERTAHYVQSSISLDQSSPRKPASILHQEFPPEILEHFLIFFGLGEAPLNESSLNTPE